MQRTFNPLNGERYPGDPLIPESFNQVGRLTLDQEIDSLRSPFGLACGESSRSARLWGGAMLGSHFSKQPVGVIATRLAYTQESGEHNLHGLPFNKPTKEKT
jgi:hypothetical protein